MSRTICQMTLCNDACAWRMTPKRARAPRTGRPPNHQCPVRALALSPIACHVSSPLSSLLPSSILSSPPLLFSFSPPLLFSRLPSLSPSLVLPCSPLPLRLPLLPLGAPPSAPCTTRLEVLSAKTPLRKGGAPAGRTSRNPDRHRRASRRSPCRARATAGIDQCGRALRMTTLPSAPGACPASGRNGLLDPTEQHLSCTLRTRRAPEWEPNVATHTQSGRNNNLPQPDLAITLVGPPKRSRRSLPRHETPSPTRPSLKETGQHSEMRATKASNLPNSPLCGHPGHRGLQCSIRHAFQPI